MRLKSLLLTCFLILSASNALSYKLINIEPRVFPGENLEYQLNITNDEVHTRQLYVNKFIIENTFGTAVNIEPSINVIIQPGENKLLNITIPVKDNTQSGYYQTPLILSYENQTTRVFIESNILNKFTEPISIENITVINPGSVSPLKSFNLTITLLSNVESSHPEIRVLISNPSRTIYDNSGVQGLTKGINVFSRPISLPKNSIPGPYSLIVQGLVGGQVVAESVNELIIKSYASYNKSSLVNEGLFGKEVRKIIVNNGTKVIVTNLDYTASIIEPYLLSSASILKQVNGDLISHDEVKFIEGVINESITLQPGESGELLIKFDYTLLILLPFILASLVIGWLFLTKRVVVDKEIIQCKQEGDDIMVKVAISVKNVSFKSIKDVRIIEDLPVFANKAGGFGSIKGDIDQEKGVIKFNAGRLDPKEEVLVSYKFKTDMELVGRVSLPPAIIKYQVNNKIKTTSSNTPIIHLLKGGS